MARDDVIPDQPISARWQSESAQVNAAVAPRPDLASFDALFTLARSQLWLVAAAITTNAAEADDVLQEAAIIGLRKFADFQQGTCFERWMAQITRNVALNALRSRQRRDRGNAKFSLQGDARAAPAPTTSTANILRGLTHLEEEARTCLLLRVVGGHSYREIALITNLPEGTAMSHVHRSRQRLRSLVLNSSEGDQTRVEEST